MKEYKLTEKGQKTLEIILPANRRTGDTFFRCRTSSINDAVASILLARKDGKGAEYVEKIQAPVVELPEEHITPDDAPEPNTVLKVKKKKKSSEEDQE